MGGSGGGGRLGDIRSLEEKAKAALRGGKRNVFISFAFEDVDTVNALRAQAKNEKSDIEFNDYSVSEPYDSERAAYIRQKISERIARSSVTVIYLSENTAKSEWVKWEVEKSIELGKKVIAVHPKSQPKGAVPDWIGSRGIKVVPWTNLSAELD
jgi:hypothetical protein